MPMKLIIYLKKRDKDELVKAERVYERLEADLKHRKKQAFLIAKDCKKHRRVLMAKWKANKQLVQ